MRMLELGELLEDVERELDRVVQRSVHGLVVELRRVEEPMQVLEVGGGALEQPMGDGQLATGRIVEVGLSRQHRELAPLRLGKTSRFRETDDATGWVGRGRSCARGGVPRA